VKEPNFLVKPSVRTASSDDVAGPGGMRQTYSNYKHRATAFFVNNGLAWAR
jgi:hypothetical protein